MCVLQWNTDYGMHASMSHVNMPNLMSHVHSANLMSHVNITNLTRDLTSQSHELNMCVTNSMGVMQWITSYEMHASMSHVNMTNSMSHEFDE